MSLSYNGMLLLPDFIKVTGTDLRVVRTSCWTNNPHVLIVL